MFPKGILQKHVSIDADESEEKNAGIEIGVKHVSVDYAELIPVWPFSKGIRFYQHREGAQEDQIRDREVKEIDVAAIPVLQAEEIAKNNNSVPSDSQNELNPIKNGKIVLFQGNLCCRPVFASCIRNHSVGKTRSFDRNSLPAT